jgi:hypothetical protein
MESTDRKNGEPTPSAAPPVRKPFKWGFASALGAVLALVVTGHIVTTLFAQWPPFRAWLTSIGGFSSYGPWSGGVLAAMGARDWVFGAFLVSTAVFVFLQRRSLATFFRSMHTGVTLVILTTVAIAIGVLVPQIDNFEDPEQRVTPANRAVELERFKWAEGYFAYHLVHLYGIGMPKGEVPPGAAEALERFGRIYGEEEGKNRAKMMESALATQPKTQEIYDFIDRHASTFERSFDVATALELNRAYKSGWFATLLTLLATAVAFNSFRFGVRRTFSMQKIGFFVTHAGILTLLAGGLVSNLLTDRGILELYLDRPPQDTYHRHYQQDKFARMPFAVRLDQFARKEWKALEVHFLTENFKSRVPRYTLWPGREIGLDYLEKKSGEWEPQTVLRVRELHDRARVRTPIVTEGTEDDGQGALPVVELEAPSLLPKDAAHAGLDEVEDEGPTRKLFMSPVLQNQAYADPEGAFRMVVAHDREPRSMFPDEGDESIGTLDVEVLGSGEDAPVPVRIKLGERVRVARDYEIAFVEATRDFSPNRPESPDTKQHSGNTAPLAQQRDGFRALWIDVYPPDGKPPERRLVLEVVDPIEYGLQKDYPNKDLVARLRWDRWSEPGAPRYVLAWGTGVEPALIGQDGTRTRVVAGEPLPLPGSGTLRPLRFFQRARFEKNIQFLPNEIAADGWDKTFYERSARGLVLDVVTHAGQPDEKVQTLKMATTENGSADRWFSEDGRFAIVFLENTEGFPYDWRSVLSIIKRDADGKSYVVDCGAPNEREIRVNDYFKYGGYRFFQTNADPSRPNYSGIGVVYDPGIPIVLTGMYTIIAGTVLAFLVRPIWQARTRRPVAAGATSTSIAEGTP